MGEKISDGKAYRLYIDRESHINQKVNKDGRKAALQFSNKENHLTGPVEIEEIDLAELEQAKDPNEIKPYIKWILDNIVAPQLNYALEVGQKKLLQFIAEKGIPTMKQKVREITSNGSVYIQGIKDGLCGKETKASHLMLCNDNREKNRNEESAPIEVQASNEKIACTPEEVQYLIELMNRGVSVTAYCIRILTNTIVYNATSDPDILVEAQKQIETLSTQTVLKQIDQMLDEKNRASLDENTYNLLYEFRKGNFIVNGTDVPITQYFPYDNDTD